MREALKSRSTGVKKKRTGAQYSTSNAAWKKKKREALKHTGNDSVYKGMGEAFENESALVHVASSAS